MISKSFRFLYFFVGCLLACCLAAQSVFAADDVLSAQERKWLASHPEIRIAVTPVYPPLSFLDDKGELTGLTNDYFALIQKRLGIKLKLVIPDAQQSAANHPKEKNADAVGIFADTPERREYWTFTKPYLKFDLYLIARDDAKDIALRNLSGQKVSAVSNFAARTYIEQKYPEVVIDPVADTCTGLQHVAFGKSKAVITDLPVASWCLRDQGLINLKIAEKTEFTYSMGIGVRKDWPMLHSILQKGLNTISVSEREEIYRRWTTKNVFVESWVQKNKLWLATLALVILGALLIRLYVWDSLLHERILKKVSSVGDFDEIDPKTATNSRRIAMPSMLGFLFAIIVIFGFLVATHEWYTKQDRFILMAIIGILLIITLIGGYKLGGLRRTRDVEKLFAQLVMQVKSREASERTISESEQRLLNQNAALSKLTASQLVERESPDDVFKELTEISAHTIQVDRVSIWLFSDDEQTLNCANMFNRTTAEHTAGQSLQASDFPQYFQSLATHRVIVASDAMTHTATSEFAAEYLPAHGIGSMLDGTIWLNEKVIGVICHEHIGGIRNWTLDEQSFAGSIADLARLTIETHKRRSAERALIEHKNHLEDLVEARTASLENSAKMFRFMVERAPVSIFYMNLDHKFMEFNPEAERATGYSREFALTKTSDEIFYIGEQQARYEELSKRIHAGEKLQAEEVAIKCADGSVIDLAVSCSLENDTNGNPFIICIGQDMSRQKALEASLIKAREAAESADRIKSMFVASMSHELRTPLNSIIGFLGVVLQGMSGDLNVKQKDQLSRAYHSAKHLLSLISDVIDISKIEAGYLYVHVESFELKPLLIEAEHAVHHHAQDKHIDLTIECPKNLQLETDRKRLYQVILNVMSNAVKYTEQGSVQVKASVEEQSLTITVKDTGIGMEVADLARLFQPFERMDSRLKIKTLGTGLGLYLTRKILTQLLGGNIEVESKVEEGSTFTISIPIKLGELPPEQVASVLESAS